jgi:glycosyltransferase involved in cell wall biosynthesis
MIGLSVVIPVHNGAAWLQEVIAAIGNQAKGSPFEILVIEDRSTDGSRAMAERLADRWPIRVLDGGGRGAAAAINLGLRVARYPFICQLDQDVVVLDGWLPSLLRALEGPTVAAAQGHYVAAPHASLAARLSAFDLAERYHAMQGREIDHVCTGNTIYRASALVAVGGLDETLGYGYDNDLSYRLKDAGFELAFVPAARSIHHWRRGLRGFCAQHYGQGYGRLQLIAKHPARRTGDSVSPWPMMLHPPVMVAAVVLGLAAALAIVANWPWAGVAGIAALLMVTLLIAERAIVGAKAAWRFKSGAPLLFPAFHLLRDLVWLAAIATWGLRRIGGMPAMTTHSMRRRRATTNRPDSVRSTVPSPGDARLLVLIPAHNESQALPRVIADVRAHCPGAELLVIDDGSSDDTARVAELEGCNWIRLPVRMGIGSAMRAGLRYASRRRAGVVVRIDGDGQHRGEDVAAMVAPILAGRADVVLGSRYVPSGEGHAGTVRLVQRVLGFCLSRLTGQSVTDPTSGFYALGPGAVRLLCEHHPTGYPEPELRLLLSRYRIRVLEMPMRTRQRQGGRSTLTPFRLAAAAARVLLAMVIVPLRHATDNDGD